jgi:hypothetical protein
MKWSTKGAGTAGKKERGKPSTRRRHLTDAEFLEACRRSESGEGPRVLQFGVSGEREKNWWVETWQAPEEERPLF